MTGGTHSIFEGSVVNCPARLQTGCIMTVVAKIPGRLQGIKGLWGRRGLVADLALDCSNRIVGARFQEPGLGRGMGIVATRAGSGLLHWVLTVSLFELRCLRVVTIETKGDLSFHQQVLFLRAVGKVAC